MKTKVTLVISVMSARKLENEQRLHRNIRPENAILHQRVKVNHPKKLRRFHRNRFDNQINAHMALRIKFFKECTTFEIENSHNAFS